jgi:ubiquinone/menaquinone biosynthesis C-methylase UbiE
MTFSSPEEAMFQTMTWMAGGLVTLAADAGYRSGLLEAAADAGAVTPAELAATGDFSERHVREWLGLMATAGIFAYEPGTGRFTLDPNMAAVLPMFALTAQLSMFGKYVPDVVRTLQQGGGIPYSDYPEFTAFMDSVNRATYDGMLVDGHIAAVAGLTERFEAGASVLDIGCGSGHVVNLLGRAFPKSTFVGYDFNAGAIAAAGAEADAWGLGNVRFEVRDVARLPGDDRFDVVTAFDCIHDQARPRQVLAEVHRVLVPGGMFVMFEPKASSHVEDNVGNLTAQICYGVSLFHCLQVSLAENGEGLGAAWGEQLARELLAEAGFGEVETIDPPADFNRIFVCR